MLKRFISVFALAVLLTASISQFNYVEGAHGADSGDLVKYHLDVGVTHIWGRGSSVETAVWDNGYKKGAELNVTGVLEFPKPIKTVTAYRYSEDKFNWDDANLKGSRYTFNTNPQSLLKGKVSFEEYYLDFCSSKITNISVAANKNKVTLKYTVLLESNLKNIGFGDDFDLKFKLYKGEKDFVFSLLGGEDLVRAAYPEVTKRFDEAKAGTLDPDLYGYLYFVPLIIEYTEANTCTICGDLLPDGQTRCNKDSCPYWDSPDCGCYEPPEAPQAVPPPDTSGSCTDVIRWSETESHTYYCGGKNCSGHTCNHVYTYQSRLNTTATLKSLKPNGTNTTFKSGYGFTVDLNNSLTTSQISNAGACGTSKTKANSKIPQAPQAAEVQNNWTVKLKNVSSTQPQNVALVKNKDTTSATGFVTAANPISAQKTAAIYTDVALSGTKQTPIMHTIKAYTFGGGVNGIQFCKSVDLKFTINGNMYEDDWTVDGGNQNTR